MKMENLKKDIYLIGYVDGFKTYERSTNKEIYTEREKEKRNPNPNRPTNKIKGHPMIYTIAHSKGGSKTMNFVINSQP